MKIWFLNEIFYDLEAFKVAAYSFIFARVPGTKAYYVICECLKEDVCFSIFSRPQHKHKRQNWQWIFLRFFQWNSVKCETVNKCFTSVELVFQGSLSDYPEAVKDKFAEIGETVFTDPTLLVFQIYIRRTVRIMEDFIEGNSRKSQKNGKNAYVWTVIIVH